MPYRGIILPLLLSFVAFLLVGGKQLMSPKKGVAGQGQGPPKTLYKAPETSHKDPNTLYKDPKVLDNTQNIKQG